MANWKFHFETYGCKVNQYETQSLREAWNKLGGTECDRPEEADFICINSCAITAKAERDARNALGRLRRLAPKAKIILTGCAAQFFNDFKPRKNVRLPQPDLCICQTDKNKLLLGPQIVDSCRKPVFGIIGYSRARPVVKIQDGCTQNCTYCIVPKTREKSVSRPREEVLNECRALFEKGYGEIMLSGVNLRQYHNGGDFWDLLELLDRSLAGQYGTTARIRISSLEPAQLTARGLDILLSCQLVCPHVHLSVQHASLDVLRRMGRGHYDAEKILNAVQELRKHWPIMGLGADLLVGFPGETERDLELLLEFVKAAGLSYAHVFPYSRRPLTRAGEMPGQIPQKEKQARAELVRQQIASQKYKFLQTLLGVEYVHVVGDVPIGDSETSRGVNEFYAACRFKKSDMKKGRSGIFMCRPVGIQGETLLVEG